MALERALTGATVMFDGNPAQILYSSASQINLIVAAGVSKKTVMQISANGLSAAARQFPVVRSNPNLFADRTTNTDCFGFSRALALLASNEDGTRNSCINPAKLGSIISLYLHAVGNPGCSCFDASFGGRSVAVVNVTALDNFVTRVDLMVPNSLETASAVRSFPTPILGVFQVSPRVGTIPAGPVPVPTDNVVNVAGALVIYAGP